MILQEHHIKSGLNLQRDDHTIELRHGCKVIARWITTGLLSAADILREADDYIAEQVNGRA